MENVIEKKVKGGTEVTINTNCGNKVDKFFVPKYNGKNYCINSTGYFNFRYTNAIAKAKQIEAKRNREQVWGY